MLVDEKYILKELDRRRIKRALLIFCWKFFLLYRNCCCALKIFFVINAIKKLIDDHITRY